MSTAQTPQRTKCEIFTRVMGYYRPVSQFNIGKKAEFYSRTYFDPKTTDTMSDMATDANDANEMTADGQRKIVDNCATTVNTASKANAAFNRTYQYA